jgi:hypothetical protein
MTGRVELLVTTLGILLEIFRISLTKFFLEFVTFLELSSPRRFLHSFSLWENPFRENSHFVSFSTSRSDSFPEKKRRKHERAMLLRQRATTPSLRKSF